MHNTLLEHLLQTFRRLLILLLCGLLWQSLTIMGLPEVIQEGSKGVDERLELIVLVVVGLVLESPSAQNRLQVLGL